MIKDVLITSRQVIKRGIAFEIKLVTIESPEQVLRTIKREMMVLKRGASCIKDSI